MENFKLNIFQVFIQKDHAAPHIWVGSLVAGDREDALMAARENFLRRDKAVSIWVVKTDDIGATDYQDQDFFNEEYDKKYRSITGYNAANSAKWRQYKRALLDIEKDFIKD